MNEVKCSETFLCMCYMDRDIAAEFIPVVQLDTAGDVVRCLVLLQNQTASQKCFFYTKHPCCLSLQSKTQRMFWMLQCLTQTFSRVHSEEGVQHRDNEAAAA